MRQRELAGILYFCDSHTRKMKVHNNKNKRKKKTLEYSVVLREHFIAEGEMRRKRLICFIGSIAYG